MSRNVLAANDLLEVGNLLEQFIHEKLLNSILYYWLKLKYNSIQPSNLIIHRSQYLQQGSDGKIIVNQPSHSNAYNQSQQPSHSHHPRKNIMSYDPSIHDNNFEDIILSRLNNIEQSMNKMKNSREIYSNSQSHQHYPDETLSRIDERPISRYTNHMDSYAQFIDQRNSLDKRPPLFSPVLNSRHIKIYTQNNQDNQNQQTTSLDYRNLPINYPSNKLNSHTPSHRPNNQTTHTNKISTKDWKPRFFKQQSVHLKTLQQKYNIQSSITQSVNDNNQGYDRQQRVFSRRINSPNNYLNNNAKSQSNYYAWNSIQQQKIIQQPKTKFNTNPQPLNYSFNPKEYSNIYNSKVLSPKTYDEPIHINNIPISHLQENISIGNKIMSKQFQRKNINEKVSNRKILGYDKKQIK